MRAFPYLVVAAACALPVVAAAEPLASPPAGFRAFERLELPNGLRALVGRPARSMLFSEVLLVARGGTGPPGSRQEEIANIAARALTAGSVSPESTPVPLALARLGVSVDSTVGREVAVFRFAVPTSNTIALLSLLAQLHGRRPISSDVWQEAVARRRDVEAREASDGWLHATSTLTALLWTTGVVEPARPLQARMPIANGERLELARFWDQAYSTPNVVLSVWGDLATSDVARAIRQAFGPIARGTAGAPRRPLADPVQAGPAEVTCILHEGARPAALLVGARAAVPDDRAFDAVQLAVHVLGASYNSRLQRRLRTEAQVVYTVEATAVPIGRGGITVRVACQTDQVESTRRIVLEEFDRLTRSPVTEEELAMARALLGSRLKLDAASFRDQFYRRSLALLGLAGARQPSVAEDVLGSFTPQTLLETLRRSIGIPATATVILTSQPEPVCEANRGNTASQ